MTEAAFLQMIVLASAAAGLVGLGIARVALAGRSVGVKLGAFGGAICLPALGPVALGFAEVALYPVALVGAAAVVSLAAGSDRLFAGLRRFRRPAVQGGVLSVAGVALLVGAVARYEDDFATDVEQDMSFMREATWKPPLDPVPDVVAATDAGRPIPLFTPKSTRPDDEVMAAERRGPPGVGVGGPGVPPGPAGGGVHRHRRGGSGRGGVWAAGRAGEAGCPPSPTSRWPSRVDR